MKSPRMVVASKNGITYIEWNKEKTSVPQHRSLRFDPNKPLQVGGQAVIEGVMMRAPGRIATAVRRSNGEIVVKTRQYVSLAERYPLFKLPILRGAVGLVEMLVVGIETLNYSADVALKDIQEKERANGNGRAHPRKQRSNLKIALTVVFSLSVGIVIFFVTPLLVTTQFFSVEQNAVGFNLIAGAIRLSILLVYLSAISMMKDVKRLFEYHGAEHKAVFTFESGAVLTPSSASQYTRFHPRCGTSFILIVAITAVLLFAVFDAFLIGWLGQISLPIRLVTHLPLIPLVGGVAYEFVRWSAKRSTTTVGRVLVTPGLWLQRITTREPDHSQLEVALVALHHALGLADGPEVHAIPAHVMTTTS
jgi:uncharacterized protein YqhQ